MRVMRRGGAPVVFALAGLVGALFPRGLWAQGEVVKAAPAPSAQTTRAALAAAYLRMDRAYETTAAAGMSDSVRSALNRRFDGATLAFFGGKFAAAVASIDTAILMLPSAARAEAIAPVPPPRSVNGGPPSLARAELKARLEVIDSTGPLAQAVFSTRARLDLLVDEPNVERSAEFLSNPSQLARDLTREITALEKGRDPYIGVAGDTWRAFRSGSGAMVPMRVVASPAANLRRPVGVLIALHGAGGDENMFVDAYGQGVVATLAKEQRLLLVSPATTQFSASPANFDTLMAVLRREFRIDSTRIYVIGHSMGAGAAARLAQQRPQQLAAVVCLAGGSAVTAANAPPMLFIGASLDPIIPARTVEAAAKATPTGTYEVLPYEGHTLMVGRGVRRAMPWLMQHTRTITP